MDHVQRRPCSVGRVPVLFPPSIPPPFGSYAPCVTLRIRRSLIGRRRGCGDLAHMILFCASISLVVILNYLPCLPSKTELLQQLKMETWWAQELQRSVLLLRLLQGQDTVVGRLWGSFAPRLAPFLPPSPCSVTTMCALDWRCTRFSLIHMMATVRNHETYIDKYRKTSALCTHASTPRTRDYPPAYAVSSPSHRKTRPVNSVRRWLLKPPLVHARVRRTLA